MSAGEEPAAMESGVAGDPDDLAPPASASSRPDDPEVVRQIADEARDIARERLRQALELQATSNDAEDETLDPVLLDRIAEEEAARAGGPLLRLAVIQAAARVLGIQVSEAVGHHAAVRAQERLRAGRRPETSRGTAKPVREPMLLIDAVHVFGIESVEAGDGDIELRFSRTGIDVHRPSTRTTIGRLAWEEIQEIEVQRSRRGLPGMRRPAQLMAGTDRGEVTFELVGLSDEEIADHLEPLIARNCEGFRGAVAS